MKKTTEYVYGIGTVGLRPGQPMVPEPCGGGDRSDDFFSLAERLDNIPEDPDCLDDRVPDGAAENAAESRTDGVTDRAADVSTVENPGTAEKKKNRTLKIPDLVSIWKFMLSRKYAKRRLVFYTYLNGLLRTGRLSGIVGFKVLTPVINKTVLELKQPYFWGIDRENFYADVEIELKLKASSGLRTWLGIISCWCSFENNAFSMTVEGLMSSEEYNGGEDRKEGGLVKRDGMLRSKRCIISNRCHRAAPMRKAI